MPRVVLLLVLAVGATALTGCNKFGYDAQIESVDVNIAWVTVRGWYHDPLLDKRGTLCADIVLMIDGIVDPVDRGCTPAGRRTDVERLTGRWSFDFSRTRWFLTKGTHEACVSVVPPGELLITPPNHCVTFQVANDQSSLGVIDTAEVVDGELRAEGWYSNPPFTSTIGLTRPTWYVDGRWIRLGQADDAVIETVDRPDVVAAVGPYGRGHRLRMPVASGSHTVCLGLDDGFGGWGAPTLCRTVTAP